MGLGMRVPDAVRGSRASRGVGARSALRALARRDATGERISRGHRVARERRRDAAARAEHRDAAREGARHRRRWPELLRLPSYNVELGAYYLHKVLATFGGQVALAAAAYNAGPRAQGGSKRAKSCRSTSGWRAFRTTRRARVRRRASSAISLGTSTFTVATTRCRRLRSRCRKVSGRVRKTIEDY